jgi:hypothetical protein
MWRTGSGWQEAVISVGHRDRRVRFIRVDGVSHQPIRGSAQPWDTGGIILLLIRSRDIEGVVCRSHYIR